MLLPTAQRLRPTPQILLTRVYKPTWKHKEIFLANYGNIHLDDTMICKGFMISTACIVSMNTLKVYDVNSIL